MAANDGIVNEGRAVAEKARVGLLRSSAGSECCIEVPQPQQQHDDSSRGFTA